MHLEWKSLKIGISIINVYSCLSSQSSKMPIVHTRVGVKSVIFKNSIGKMCSLFDYHSWEMRKKYAGDRDQKYFIKTVTLGHDFCVFIL